MSTPDQRPRKRNPVRVIDLPARRRGVRSRGQTDQAAGAPAARPARAVRRGRDFTWVSKTDLAQFLRCPFAFWQIDRRAITPEAAFGPRDRELIEEGNAFHAAVAAGAPALPTAITLDAAIRLDTTLTLPLLLRNPDLRIVGIPDQIIAADGDLLPVEVKSHRDVQRSDELELAFYWLLLEPRRRQPAGPPRGRLILRRDGQPAPIDIEIAPERFDEVHDLIDQIRQARRHGVRPRLCKCPVCTGPLRDEVTRSTHARHDLTLIRGIDRLGPHLEALGIPDYDALRDCDPVAVALALRDCGVHVSPAQVQQWARHAESYDRGEPVVFGPPPAVGASFIALDLEYDSQAPPIWLTGLLIIDGEQREHIALWADNPPEERHALRTLIDVCAAHPDLPIVTWNGDGAEFPQLRGAAGRHGDTDAIAALQTRHLDLYQHTYTTIRLPIPTLTLDAIAAHLGIPKNSTIYRRQPRPEALQDVHLQFGLCAPQDPARRADRLQS